MQFQLKVLKSYFVIAIIFILQSLGHAGYEVGNGGGLAERNFQIALEKIPFAIDLCKQNKSCATDSEDKRVLEKVAESFQIGGWIEHRSVLKFISASQFLENFSGGLSRRIWGQLPNDKHTILINSERIVSKANGKIEPFSVAQAFRVLFVAIGGMDESNDQLLLEGLAFKIQKLIFESSLGTSPSTEKKVENPISPEERLRMFTLNMEHLLVLCLQSEECLPESLGRDLLNRIQKNMSLEPDALHLLKFESGSTNPSRFLIEGVMKSAVTGLQPGSIIYFNTDFLLQSDGANLRSISEESLLSLLLHELGHHTGEISHSFLDRISSQVALFLVRHLESIDFVEDIEMAYFHKPAFFNVKIIQSKLALLKNKQRPQVIMSDEVKYYDFKSPLEKEIKCGAIEDQVEGYWINSAFWNGKFSDSGEYRWVDYIENGKDSRMHIELINYNFEVDASVQCQTPSGVSYTLNQRLEWLLRYTSLFEADTEQGVANRKYVLDQITRN